MADYVSMARDAARRAGLDPNVFVRQIRQESGFRPDARSGAGALGIAQIMPGTARSWKVDPMNPRAALNAAASNMASYVKKYGSYENALRAYNAGPGAIEASKGYAETNNYVRTILNGRDPGGLSTPSRGGGGGQTTTTTTTTSPTVALAQTLLPATLPERPRVQITAPQAPGFAAKLATATAPGGAALAAPSAPVAPRPTMGAALEAMQKLQPTTTASLLPGQTQTTRSTTGGGGGSTGGGGSGSFKISGGNPSRLNRPLVSFANKVADQYGGKFVGLDGSTHSKYTTTGNISDHWAGNATDIFTVNGKSLKQNQGMLLQVGRAALIAAGMDPAKARKAPFGLYNVGGHQIIFGTNSKALGGDHTDHLHISAR